MTERPMGGAREALPGVFISGALCVYIERERAAVVADLHIGFEAVAAADGAFFPKRQKPVLEKRLRRILELFRPELLVIAGDFKHNFGRGAAQEWNEVGELYDALESRVDLVLVRGNHDNYLQSIVSSGPIPLRTRVGEALVLHGHRSVPEFSGWAGPRVLAHEHPSLKLRDSIGAQLSTPAFLVEPETSTIVLPALSPLAPGSDFLRAEPASPLLRGVDRSGMRVFACADGELLDFGIVASLIDSQQCEIDGLRIGAGATDRRSLRSG
ncbi:MAG: metallophosphoesterase [Thermoplasmatota archaeon]